MRKEVINKTLDDLEYWKAEARAKHSDYDNGLADGYELSMRSLIKHAEILDLRPSYLRKLSIMNRK